MNRIITLIYPILLITLLSLLLHACSIDRSVGGKCNPVTHNEIAQVINTYKQVELKSENGSHYQLALENFTPDISNGEYYQLEILTHSSGGCKPFTINKIAKLSEPNLSLNPRPGQIYQGAFILSEAQNCAFQSPNTCRSTLKLSNSFDLPKHKTNLNGIKPKSLHACSPYTLALAWSKISIPNEQSRIISCVNTVNGNEIPVEFLLVDSGTKHKGLLLNNFY